MAATVHTGIVTYNSLVDLPRCLEGLRAQTYPHLQVTVADNASTDGTLAWLRGYGDLPITIFANAENLGFAAAHNRIIRAAGLAPGDVYMALNPDVWLAPDYVEMVLQILQSDDRIGWATGQLRQMDESGTMSGLLYSAGHALTRSGYAFHVGYGCPCEAFAESGEVFGAPGAAVLMKQGMIADLTANGAFYDEAMFLYGEDVDVDWRARLRGWRCWYVAGAVAGHRGSNPGPDLRIQALGNRYIAVIKSAFLRDLFLYNIPLMSMHVCFRLLTTPRAGLRLAAMLFRGGPEAWRRRQGPRVPRRDMLTWFRRAGHERTTQPVTLCGRLRRFFTSQSS